MTTDQIGDRLDRYVTVMAFWPIIGAILDSRYHATGGVESFWTLRHAVIYSGVFALLGVFIYMLYRGWDEETGLMEALPDGYNMAMVGLLIISVGGLGDMIWHTLFGVEQSGLELGSPSHLLLGVGALVLSATPLRRAWGRDPDPGWKEQFPMLTSAAFLLTILSYLVYSIHPLVLPYLPVWSEWAALELAPLAGAAGIVLYTMFLVGITLHLSNEFELVPGAFTYIIGLNAVLMTVPYSLMLFVPAALMTGVVADLLRISLRPLWHRQRQVLLYAFTVPMTFSSLYVLTVFLTGGTPWNIHQWSAFMVLPGITGLITVYGICTGRDDSQDA